MRSLRSSGSVGGRRPAIGPGGPIREVINPEHTSLACHGLRRTPVFAKATPDQLFRRSVMRAVMGDGKSPRHFFADEVMVAAFPSAMKPTDQHPQPPVSMVEEWDNPAMTEFKRQEAEERVAFGCSLEARQWLEHLRTSLPPDVVIRVAPKAPKRFPFKPVRLPW